MGSPGQYCRAALLNGAAGGESPAHVSFAVFIFILHKAQGLIDGILFSFFFFKHSFLEA